MSATSPGRCSIAGVPRSRFGEAVTVVALLLLVGCREAKPEIHARLALAEALAAPTEGYARATEPRTFEFPADHGPHPAFATEWWYFTGNLTATDGRRFGYELTFFRKALAADAPPRQSTLAADQVFMAHFAVTDAESETFHAFDRFARAAAGLAGARPAPFRVWLHDWSIESIGDSTFPARIRAADGDVAIDLIVEQGKAPVLQGERGLSRKSATPGNASYYYSLTRMPTRGTITIGEASVTVDGASWMDREWGTSELEPDLAGWDWFAIQLSDSTELMLYQLRRTDGGASPFSAGSAVNPRGTSRTLSAADFTIDVLDHWRSPRDHARYPSRWRVHVPSERLELIVTPTLADQELNLTVRYWEGAVDVTGSRGNEPVTGRGYVELTGYAERTDAARRTHDGLRGGV